MRPFTGISRFLQPDNARIAQASFLAFQGLYLSVRHKSTLYDARPFSKLDSPDTAEVAVTSDSSQHVSAVVPTAVKPRKARPGDWTSDEIRRLEEMYAKGLRIKAIAPLFPDRSIGAVLSALRTVRDSLHCNSEPSRHIGPLRWPEDDKKLLAKLYSRGASIPEVRRHFPTRSINCITTAMYRAAKPPSKSHTHIHKGNVWSEEDVLRLRECSKQGMDIYSTAEALGRTYAATQRRSSQEGITLRSTVNTVTADEVRLIMQMRSEKIPFRTIAEMTGRHAGSVMSIYYLYRPLKDCDARIRPVQLVRRPSLEPGHPEQSLGRAQEGFAHLTRVSLSPTEMQRIEHLRREGKSWQFIADTKEFFQRSKGGVRTAYHRTLERHQSQT